MEDLDLKSAAKKFPLLQAGMWEPSPIPHHRDVHWAYLCLAAGQKVGQESRKGASSDNFEQEPHNVRFGTALIGHQYCHLNLGSVHKCAINGKIPCDTGVKHAAH